MTTEHRRRIRRWGLTTAIGTAIAALAIAIGVTNAAFAATLFSDNFEDGDTSGWSKSGGNWVVATDGTRVLRQDNITSELARLFAGNTAWTNYAVPARVNPHAFDGSGR